MMKKTPGELFAALRARDAQTRFQRETGRTPADWIAETIAKGLSPQEANRECQRLLDGFGRGEAEARLAKLKRQDQGPTG